MDTKETIKPRTAPRPRKSASPIARARLASGLTQNQLAEIVGCTQKDISRYENAHHVPGVQILCKIAQALNCTMEELAE